MPGTLRPTVALAVLVTLAGCGGSDDGGTPVDVKVMTRNLYLGSDVGGVVMAASLEAVPPLAAAFWREVNASEIRRRLAMIADEIAAEKPDLVGLQEVELFRTGTPSDFTPTAAPNATTVAFDFLEILRAELVARGQDYKVAAEGVHVDVELPTAGDGGAVFDLRMTDRNVILARAGVETSNPRTGQFFLSLPVTIPIQPMPGQPFAKVPLLRGWVAVDATVGGARFTFANSHLEVGGGPDMRIRTFQEGQADELLKALEGVRGPMVLVGDFNSNADGSGTKSYGLLTKSFVDAWTVVRPSDPGPTCCSDPKSERFEPRTRIDLVLHRGGVTPKSAAIVGADPAARAASGVWASDHAGVVSTVSVPAP